MTDAFLTAHKLSVTLARREVLHDISLALPRQHDRKAFLAGLSGLGTIFANLSMALLMALCARQSWSGRSESPSCP